jgi:UDP-glucose 4-epimerase
MRSTPPVRERQQPRVPRREGGAPPRRVRRRAGGRIALTGIHGGLARAVLRRLEQDDRYEKLVLIDIRAPSMPVARARFHAIDLTAPAADSQVADVLRAEGVETLVHLALHEVPKPQSGGARELETVGTMVVLNAAADCVSRGTPLGSVVCVTTSMVYGAHPRNPNYLTEDQPLRGEDQMGFVRDKVDVERQLEEFRRQEGVRVCVIRPSWTLGASGSMARRLLDPPAALTVLGFDPLLQLIHPEDLAGVLKQAIDRPRDGVFNVAAPGVLPLSGVLRLAGRFAVPLPAPIAYSSAALLWRLYGVGIGVSLDYLRYLWLVDDERARALLGFAPRWDVRAIVQEYARGPGSPEG